MSKEPKVLSEKVFNESVKRLKKSESCEYHFWKQVDNITTKSWCKHLNKKCSPFKCDLYKVEKEDSNE